MSLLTEQYALTSVHPPFFAPGIPTFPPFHFPAVHVTYVETRRLPGGGPDPEFVIAPKLTYQDASQTLVFSGDEIAVSEIDGPHGGPPLGRLLTVQLTKTVDTGASYFTLLLPGEPATAGTVDHFPTTGVTSVVPGPDSVIKRQTWQTMSFYGTYSATESH